MPDWWEQTQDFFNQYGTPSTTIGAGVYTEPVSPPNPFTGGANINDWFANLGSPSPYGVRSFNKPTVQAQPEQVGNRVLPKPLFEPQTYQAPQYVASTAQNKFYASQRAKQTQWQQAKGWAQMRQQATSTQKPQTQYAQGMNKLPMSQQMQNYGWAAQRWAKEHPGQPMPKAYSNPLTRAQEEASVKAQYSQGYAALSAYLNLLGTKPQEQPQPNQGGGYGGYYYGGGGRYKQQRWAESLPGVVWRMNQ